LIHLTNNSFNANVTEDEILNTENVQIVTCIVDSQNKSKTFKIKVKNITVSSVPVSVYQLNGTNSKLQRQDSVQLLKLDI